VGSTPTFGTSRHLVATEFDVGAWLSLVERSVRVAEVGGSNPLAPTTSNTRPADQLVISGPMFSIESSEMCALDITSIEC
jgi:hypothetical protein